MNQAPILLGTSSFTATGWNGTFYPKRMQPADYLSFHAKHFHTVEVDSTFYACPAARTVSNWESRTPEGFVFSVKVPKVITHEKVLTDCESDWNQFLDTMDILGRNWGEGLTDDVMKKCVWVRPELVAQIEFLEWTEGDHLRHARFVGVRQDKDARLVIKEQVENT